MKLSNEAYDQIKWFASIFLPAFATFYFAISQIFPQVPLGEQVIGTTTALTLFLMALLKQSSNAYNADQEANKEVDGTLEIGTTAQGTVIYSLQPGESLKNMAFKDTIVLQVVDRDEQPPSP